MSLPRLLAITCGGPDLAARVRRVLGAGAGVIVREPGLVEGIDPREVILHARTPGAVDVATALHLPADFDVAHWRARFHGVLGASAHSAEEAAEKAREGADYVVVSPTWEARHGRPALGVDAVRECAALGVRTVFALGGATPARAREAIAAGAAGVAAMGGVFGAEEEAAARAFLAAMAARA